MGVVCQILLKKTKDGVFRAGAPVAGTLKYHVNKPTKFESIYISLVGNGKCQWSESDSDNTTYYSNKEEYVSVRNYLFIKENTLSGTYESPFELLLPDNIPTSFKNHTCTIDYKIEVKFVKANFFGSVIKFDADVLVYGYVSPCSEEPLIFGLQKELLSLSSNNKVSVKAEIERTFLTPGENIKLRLQINHDSNVPVTIKTELLKHFTYVSSVKHKKVVKETVKTTKEYSPSLKENSVSYLTCIMPTLPSLYSIQHTKILIGEYKVRVTAQLPFPHINATVEIPVVIGEGRDQLGAVLAEKPSSSKVLENFEKISKPDDEKEHEKYDDSWKELQFS